MEVVNGLTVDADTLRAFCRRHGIRSLRLFGSAMRGELRPDSDIDLLVDFEPGRTPGLFTIAQLELDLQEMLGRDVDLRTASDLSPHFRDEVVTSARVLYDAA
jgi:uncharacterized protein